MSSGDWGSEMGRGLVWSSAAFVGARVLSSLSLLVLGRLLTPSEFGVVAAVTAFMFLIELLSDVGMRATVVYEQEQEVTDRVQSAFTVNLLLAAALSLLSFLLAPAIAGFFHAGEHVDLFRLAAANPLLKGLGNIHDGLLLRAMQFRRRLVSQVVEALVRAAVSIPLAAVGLGATALVLGLLAGTSAWTAVLWVQTRFRPSFRLDLQIVRSMAAYGTAASLVDIVASVSSRLDLIVIGRVLGDRALGLYALAFRVPELLIESVAWNTATVAFPALARKRKEDRDGLPDATRTIVRFQALYAVPVSTWLAVVGSPLVVTLFGAKWVAAGGVASAIAVFAGITALVFPMGDVFKALGRQRTFLLLQSVQVPVTVAAILLAAPAGIVPVAWARVASRAVYATVFTVVVARALATPVGSFVSALGPGLTAAAGVLIGTGGTRLLWPELAAGPLITATVAGAACGTLFLRLFASREFGDLKSLAGSLIRRRRASAPGPANVAPSGR